MRRPYLAETAQNHRAPAQNGANDPNLLRALHACKEIAERILYLERAVENAKAELAEAWLKVPAMPVRRWRQCRICRKPTLDMLDDRPQCNVNDAIHRRTTALDILQGNL